MLVRRREDFSFISASISVYFPFISSNDSSVSCTF